MISPLKQSMRDYAAGVTAGEIPASRYIKRTVARYLHDVATAEARGLYFDEAAASRAIRFIECLRHSKGKWRGRPLILAGWQRFIVGNIFGWKWRASGFRRFKRAYVEIPRKNGKSTLAAAIALYLFVADGEGAPEVYTAATSRKQAKIVFGECSRMVKACRALRASIAVLQNGMTIANRDALLEPVHSKSENLDGLNTHGYVVDEYHEHRSSETLDKLKTSTGSRDQAFGLIITTAGRSIESVCYQARSTGIRVLEGVDGITDDALFVFIACLDDGDDWADEATWARCNPNLGVSRSLQNMREDLATARNGAAEEADFKRYYLNKWTNEESVWLDLDDWRACDATAITEDELAGRDCYLGIDFASKTDLTACSYYFPATALHAPTLYVRFFIPADNIAARDRRDQVGYAEWTRAGWLTATPGNWVDQEAVRDDILRLNQVLTIRTVGVDINNMAWLAPKLIEDGLDVVQVRQGILSLNDPSKEFEGLIVRHQLRHGGHPVLAWQVSHCCVERDKNDNIMPHKRKSRERIDGIAATINALRVAIDAKEPEEVGVQFL